MAPKKLLVADDSLTIQKVIRLALSSEGYEIQAVSDGGDVVQQICTFRPDAVLIDVSLPTRSAFEIKREINSMADYAAIRFVLMSSAFEKIDEAQMDEAGFDGHLTKPFDPAHLRQVLSQVLSQVLTQPTSVTQDQRPPRPPAESETSGTDPSIKIQLDSPVDLAPSDFELDEEASEPTRVLVRPPKSTSAAPPAAPPLMKREARTPPPTVEIREEEKDEIWGASSSAAPESEHDEIRQLTESTIRLSGLADMPEIHPSDLDWRVNEPSLKPPSSLADVGEGSFQMDSFPPPRPGSAPPRREPVFTPPPAPEAHEIELSAGSVDNDGIRRQVHETLQATIEKMARELLPEVAERVIKQEISRILNEKF